MNAVLCPRTASIGRATRTLAAASAVALAGLLPTAASAVPMVEPPSYVNTEQYLRFTINHHYSALRITELAAGTAAVGSTSNYGGAPDVFAASQAKATNSVALEVATMANATQRMELVEGQNLLRTYYGTDFVPTLEPVFDPLLATLDAAAPGDAFNIAFLESFSGHHQTLSVPSAQCATAAPQADVRAYCAMIVEGQTHEINMMQAELASAYGITSYPYETVPLVPANGAFASAGGGTAVPEPASAALFAAGLLGLGLVRGRQGKMSQDGVLVA